MNFTNDLILEDSRLRLEPLQIQHFEELLIIALESPDLLKYSPSPFGTADKLKAYIEIALNARKNEQRYPFAIFDKSKKRFIGSTSFGNVSIAHGRLEIGWTWIDKQSQGTGLNRRCKLLLLDYVFNQLKLKRVEFKVDARNIQSKRALEKLGAKFEGVLRSHTQMEDNYRRDTAYFSILEEEWTAINKDL